MPKKNIEEIMDELKSNYHLLRQGKIDEELFDVVAGFKSINKKQLYQIINKVADIQSYFK